MACPHRLGRGGARVTQGADGVVRWHWMGLGCRCGGFSVCWFLGSSIAFPDGFKKVREDTAGHACAPSPAEVPSVLDLMGLVDPDRARPCLLHCCSLSRCLGQMGDPRRGMGNRDIASAPGREGKPSFHMKSAFGGDPEGQETGRRSRQAELGSRQAGSWPLGRDWRMRGVHPRSRQRWEPGGAEHAASFP